MSDFDVAISKAIEIISKTSSEFAMQRGIGYAIIALALALKGERDGNRSSSTTGNSNSVGETSGSNSGTLPQTNSYFPESSPSPNPIPRSVRAGEIIAWRAWNVENRSEFHLFRRNVLPSDLILKSITREIYWTPKSIMTADEIPSPSCQHGFYALKTRKEVKDYYRVDEHDTPYVIGQVSLWGEVIEGSKGYRAEYAKIISLEIPRRRNYNELKRLQEIYIEN